MKFLEYIINIMCVYVWTCTKVHAQKAKEL